MIISKYIRNPQDLVYFDKIEIFDKLKENDTIDNLALRPVILNVGTATYKTAKYLGTLLLRLTSSQYQKKLLIR